jgi:AraC family transcriptional regulator, transcriptional activator of pobA
MIQLCGMSKRNAFTLINSQNGNLAFKVMDFEGSGYFDHIQRNNFYSLIFVWKGTGIVKVDFSDYELNTPAVFAFSPYQPFMFSVDEEFIGSVVQFHPDFFCIHKHQNEVACNGVLFNNIYQAPYITLEHSQQQKLSDAIKEMKEEVQNTSLAQYELLLSHLKIMLINLSRIKVEQHPKPNENVIRKNPPFILQNLKEAIEQNYRTKHSAGDYAELLHISPKALTKITKTHFNKTLTGLISERIIIEAKRELYLTSKTIKEIAYELGYDDEYYFSRFFKTNTDISPQFFRETVGFAAAELL